MTDDKTIERTDMTTDSPASLDLADIPVTTLRGENTTFGDLVDGRAALVVNVASRCGLAPRDPGGQSAKAR